MKIRIGLYSAGLKTYWSQFEGMRERLISYGKFIEEKLSQYGEVYNFGLVDDEFSGREAGEWLNSKNIDIVFSHSATYYTSSSVLPIHQICKAPVIILNLQPTAEMNYLKTTTGEWLAHCGACPIPEICNAFNRANIEYTVINGLLGLDYTPEISVTDEVTCERPEAKKAWKEIIEWIKAAEVKRTLQHSRFGFLGNNYSGMDDEIYNYLKVHKKRQKNNCDLFGNMYSKNDFVCTWDDGRPFSPEYLSHAFKRILKKNNLPNIRFHDIRHSVATGLLNSGIDLKVIQEYLGHSTIGITANYYLHPDINEKSKALQQIGRLLQ